MTCRHRTALPPPFAPDGCAIATCAISARTQWSWRRLAGPAPLVSSRHRVWRPRSSELRGRCKLKQRRGAHPRRACGAPAGSGAARPQRSRNSAHSPSGADPHSQSSRWSPARMKGSASAHAALLYGRAMRVSNSAAQTACEVAAVQRRQRRAGAAARPRACDESGKGFRCVSARCRAATAAASAASARDGASGAAASAAGARGCCGGGSGCAPSTRPQVARLLRASVRVCSAAQRSARPPSTRYAADAPRARLCLF